MLNRINFSIASLIDPEAMGPMAGLLVSPESTMETDGHQFFIVTSPAPKEGNSREMAVIDISTETDGTATLAVNDDERRTIVKSEKITGTFPSLARITPNIAEAKFEISFNSDTLAPVLKAFQGFAGTLTLRLFSALRGVRIDAESEGQKMTAVVMPLRMVEEVVETKEQE